MALEIIDAAKDSTGFVGVLLLHLISSTQADQRHFFAGSTVFSAVEPAGAPGVRANMT